MNTDDIQFGTDGWRARIGEGYTFANLRRRWWPPTACRSG